MKGMACHPNLSPNRSVNADAQGRSAAAPRLSLVAGYFRRSRLIRRLRGAHFCRAKPRRSIRAHQFVYSRPQSSLFFASMAHRKWSDI